MASLSTTQAKYPKVQMGHCCRTHLPSQSTTGPHLLSTGGRMAHEYIIAAPKTVPEVEQGQAQVCYR